MYFKFNHTVKSFTMDKTGGYRQQYRRAYHACPDASGYESLAAHLAAVTANALANGTTESSGLAELDYVGNFLSASPVAEKVSIEGGWDAPRYAFELVVEESSTYDRVTQHHIYGYAPLSAVTDKGELCLQSEFTINSIVVTHSQGAFANQGDAQVQRFYSSHGVISNQTHSMQNPARLYLIRPQEVFGYIDTRLMPMAGFDDCEILDMRRVLTVAPRMFHRENAVADSYTAALLNAYHAVNSCEEPEGSEVERNALCQEMVSEDTANSNPLLTALAKIRNQRESHQFTLANLIALDASVADVMKVRNLRMPALHLSGGAHADESGGSDITSVTAAAIAQALPALMSTVLLKAVRVSITNIGATGQTQMLVLNGQTLVPADFDACQEAFTLRLKTLMESLSYQGLLAYALEIDANLGGEIRVHLSLNGQPTMYFVTPAFADAMLAPVLTDTEANANDVGQAFHAFFDTLPKTD